MHFLALYFIVFQPHRISVRSVNPSGRHSRDAACTIVIGKGVLLGTISCIGGYTAFTFWFVEKK